MPARKFVYVVTVPDGCWHIQFIIQIIYYYCYTYLRPSVIVSGAATQFNNNIIRYDGYKRARKKRNPFRENRLGIKRGCSAVAQSTPGKISYKNKRGGGANRRLYDV